VSTYPTDPANPLWTVSKVFDISVDAREVFGVDIDM
jgi:hypothetical protein